MSKYIGITIGPVVDTLQLAKKPGGLWYASYLFSYLSKSICSQLVKNDLYQKIVVPYFEIDANNEIKDLQYFDINLSKMGIGLFGDRIIIESDDLKLINNIVNQCKNDLIDIIVSDCKLEDEKINISNFLTNYLYVKTILVDVQKSIIKEVNSKLDALELNRDYLNSYQKNYLLYLLENNDLIKNTNLFSNKDNWLLLDKKGNIKSLAQISNINHTKLKYGNYFAICQSDGDNIGKIISSFDSRLDIINFSKKCSEYIVRSVAIVKKYGGVVIYAGGDDLLFLAPCVSSNINIMEIVKEINDVCLNVFKEFKNYKPSISFGISIQYYKYPLKEALEKAFSNLFYKAKSKKEEKNAAILTLIKHSGQVIDLELFQYSKNDYYFIKTINDIYLETFNLTNNNISIQSILYKLTEFKQLFNIAYNNKNDADELIKNIWTNKYDHVKNEELLLNKIIKFHQNSTKEHSINTMINSLRYIKFLIENEGDH